MKEYGFGTAGIIYTWHDDYDGELNEADVEHVQKMLEEGYSEGELCTVEEDGDTEHRGWWKSKEYLETVVLDADGSWQCPYCNEENNTERPEAIIQCSHCEGYYNRDEAQELVNALRVVRDALACFRDDEPIVIGERTYALEEVKYCFVDPVLERYEASHSGS